MTARYQPLYTRAPRGKTRGDEKGSGGRYILLLAFLGAVLLVALGRIYLDHCTSELGLKWERNHKVLAQQIRENENLRIERESYYSGRYILSRARGLNLRPPVPGQVRRMQYTESSSADQAIASLTNP